MNDPTTLIAALTIWAVFGLIGAACGSGRRRAGAGFMLGLFLGPLGWVVALLLPSGYTPRRRRR